MSETNTSDKHAGSGSQDFCIEGCITGRTSGEGGGNISQAPKRDNSGNAQSSKNNKLSLYIRLSKFIAKIWWWCYIWKFHDWTCAAGEGIKPTQKQLETGIDGFYDYAKMYCKRCGFISRRSFNGRTSGSR